MAFGFLHNLPFASNASVNPNDVVYLSLQGTRFRIPNALLGLLPDSLLMPMFPSGLVPVYTSDTQESLTSTIQGVRLAATASARKLRERPQRRRGSTPLPAATGSSARNKLIPRTRGQRRLSLAAPSESPLIASRGLETEATPPSATPVTAMAPTDGASTEGSPTNGLDELPNSLVGGVPTGDAMDPEASSSDSPIPEEYADVLAFAMNSPETNVAETHFVHLNLDPHVLQFVLASLQKLLLRNLGMVQLVPQPPPGGPAWPAPSRPTGSTGSRRSSTALQNTIHEADDEQRSHHEAVGAGGDEADEGGASVCASGAASPSDADAERPPRVDVGGSPRPSQPSTPTAPAAAVAGSAASSVAATPTATSAGTNGRRRNGKRPTSRRLSTLKLSFLSFFQNNNTGAADRVQDMPRDGAPGSAGASGGRMDITGLGPTLTPIVPMIPRMFSTAEPVQCVLILREEIDFHPIVWTRISRHSGPTDAAARSQPATPVAAVAGAAASTTADAPADLRKRGSRLSKSSLTHSFRHWASASKLKQFSSAGANHSDAPVSPSPAAAADAAAAPGPAAPADAAAPPTAFPYPGARALGAPDPLLVQPGTEAQQRLLAQQCANFLLDINQIGHAYATSAREINQKYWRTTGPAAAVATPPMGPAGASTRQPTPGADPDAAPPPVRSAGPALATASAAAASGSVEAPAAPQPTVPPLRGPEALMEPPPEPPSRPSSQQQQPQQGLCEVPEFTDPLAVTQLLDALRVHTHFDQSNNSWNYRKAERLARRVVSVGVLHVRPPMEIEAILLKEATPDAAKSDGSLTASASHVPLESDSETGSFLGMPPPPQPVDISHLNMHLMARQPVRKCWWEVMTCQLPARSILPPGPAVATGADAAPTTPDPATAPPSPSPAPAANGMPASQAASPTSPGSPLDAPDATQRRSRHWFDSTSHRIICEPLDPDAPSESAAASRPTPAGSPGFEAQSEPNLANASRAQSEAAESGRALRQTQSNDLLAASLSPPLPLASPAPGSGNGSGSGNTRLGPDAVGTPLASVLAMAPAPSAASASEPQLLVRLWLRRTWTMEFVHL